MTIDLNNKSLLFNRYNASICSRPSETTHVYVLELQPTGKKREEGNHFVFLGRKPLRYRQELHATYPWVERATRVTGPNLRSLAVIISQAMNSLRFLRFQSFSFQIPARRVVLCSGAQRCCTSSLYSRSRRCLPAWSARSTPARSSA
jgi:hypothetical protein